MRNLFFFFGVVLICGIIGCLKPTDIADDNDPVIDPELIAVKDSAVALVENFLAAYVDSSEQATDTAVYKYMGSIPAFSGVAFSESGVWATFSDMTVYMVVTRRKPMPEDLMIGTFPDSLCDTTDRRANLPDGKTFCIAAGLDMLDPTMMDSNGTSTGATSHSLEIAYMLNMRGKYSLSKMIDCTYEGFKRIKDVKPAVLYLNVHGAIGGESDNIYNIPTLTLWPKTIPADIHQEWLERKIIRSTAQLVDTKGNIEYFTVIAITSKFVDQYWSFQKDALVYIDGCFSAGPSAGAFRDACVAKGAGCYVGWKGISNATNCYPVVKLFFDRLLGYNLHEPNKPAQRPFPPAEVYKELKNMGKPVGKMDVYSPNPAGGMLVPSIKKMVVTERTWEEPLDGETKLSITGYFGHASGHDIKVFVNNQPMSGVKTKTAADGSIEEIECTLPADPADAGYAGNVLVTIDKRYSNKVPITLWKWKHKQRVTMSGTGLSIDQTVEWESCIRADVHPYRETAGGELQPPDPVEFRAAKGSKTKFIMKITLPEATATPESGELPYGLHNEGTMIRGYVFKGTLDVESGSLDLDNSYGAYVTINPGARQFPLYLDTYISCGNGGATRRFTVGEDYKITKETITGAIPNSSLTVEECMPEFTPGATKSVAGEDMNSAF